ncbi:MAG: TetR/AcrR family transcriptional regulator [Alphaproteobacteria bacterium]|nr:TetR/AcrR family transcriptional regulator [Alphaproteobacteria bacterium]
MARRNDHSREELKELILDAAWDIVAVNGASSLTARGIGKKIGYAAGTIYNIFPAMEVLHLHLNARTMDMLFEKLEKTACKKGGTFEEKLFQLACSYIRFSERYHPFWMALFATDIQGCKKNHSWYEEKIEKIFEPLEMILKQYLRGKNARQIEADSYILWSSVHGLVYLWVTGKSSYLEAGQSQRKSGKGALEKAISLLISTYVAGISARKITV